MTEDDIAAQGALNAGMLGSPYGNNPLGAQGMTHEQMKEAQLRRLQYHQAVQSANSLSFPPGVIAAGTPFRKEQRLNIDVQKVANGFVLSCRGEQLIAKDLEELQGLFTSQVASMLLEDK